MQAQTKAGVLLIDDDESIRAYLKVVLESMGVPVAGEAGDGREGIALFEQLSPECILLDITMPVMDGVTALKEIRQRSKDVVIMMLSSLSSADVVQYCLDAGANYHLRKDVPSDQLRRELAQAWQWLAQFRAKGGVA